VRVLGLVLDGVGDLFVPNGTRVTPDVRLRSTPSVRLSVVVPGVDAGVPAVVIQLVKQGLSRRGCGGAECFGPQGTSGGARPPRPDRVALPNILATIIFGA
jgi:hypothetical protein